MRRLRTLLVSAVGLLAVARPQERSAYAADFYAGKTINFIVGTDATGGFAIYGRLIARYLGRFIPGNPNVVFRTMPGAGSKTAATYLYKIAPKDGTVIGNILPNAILDQLLDSSGQTELDPRQFQYLAGAEHGTRVCFTLRGSKVATYEDALRTKLIVGATTPGSPTYDYAAWHRATGARFEIAAGYKGPGELFLAMERGEIDGICGLDWSALKIQKNEWTSGDKLNILVQDGIEPDPELMAMHVPQAWPYIHEDPDRRAAELIVGFQQAFGKAYLAPPGVPEDRVGALRKAFALSLADHELLDEAAKQLIEIAPRAGESVQQTVGALYATPPAILERARDMMR